LEDRLKSRLGKLVEVNKDELERKKTACGNLKKQIDNETRLLDTCIEKASVLRQSLIKPYPHFGKRDS
jgi:hypothetical protein